MELYNKDLKELSATQLILEINKTKEVHDELKKKLIDLAIEIEKKEIEINDSLIKLEIIEKHYVDLFNEYIER